MESRASAFEVLSEVDLEEALLEIDDLPVGYSQDPPTADEGNKNFCDYEVPVEEKERVRRDFTKGGGLEAELISLGIRQYDSAEAAVEAWDALTEALSTCDSEVFDGSTLTYSPMSAPDLGDDSIGVKIDADGVTLLQNFVLVGPVLVSGGGGGLTGVNADTIAGVLDAQVEKYTKASQN